MDDLDLLVLGDCNPDLVLSGADVRPRFGQQERLVDEARLTIGGSGAILACAAARLGLRTALAAVVGDDVLGHWMLDQLAGRGVEVGGCVVDPVRPTGLTVVLSEPGDRASSFAGGRHSTLTLLEANGSSGSMGVASCVVQIGSTVVTPVNSSTRRTRALGAARRREPSCSRRRRCTPISTPIPLESRKLTCSRSTTRW